MVPQFHFTDLNRDSAMYIYDNIVILSSMWYVLRFEHAHGLKQYNDRRMTRGQTTCSLGGTASLGLIVSMDC